MRRRVQVLSIALALQLVIVVAGPASAITFGEPDGNRHPNVGSIVVDVPELELELLQWCSGTLISARVFLTASHCTAPLEGLNDAFPEATVRVTDTLRSRLFDVGWPDAPPRTLRNSTVAAWEAAGRPGVGERPGEGETVATTPDGRPMVRYGSTSPLAGVGGNVEALSLWAGQTAGLIDEVRPAGALVREIAEEAAGILRGLPAMVSTD